MKIILLAIAMVFSQMLSAQLHLPSFISNGMVIQQNKANRIWGWSKPQQMVKVEFKGIKYNAYANDNGEWAVFLEPSSAGKAGSMIVSSDTEKIELKNILVGEVWVCSGQSNMELKMAELTDTYKDELQKANNDNIRFVVVNHTFANSPQQDVNLVKKWTAVTPATVGECSAVAYWYAKKLYEKLKVPIGLITTSWGGTPAESWTSLEGLHAFPDYTNTFIEKIKPLNLSGINQQKQLNNERYQKSISEKVQFVKEAVKPGFDDSRWEEMYLPKPWELQGYPALDGIVIFRSGFNIADANAGKEAVLNMPAIDDLDSTYINGTFIGTNGQWDELRKYSIPAGVLKAGKNILAIKVQDDGGGGGLSELEDNFNILVNSKTVALSGKAKYTVVAALEDVTGGHGAIEDQPAVLYDGMIAPLLPLSIRGVIWYQGESNADNTIMAKEYRSLFPAMINDWRNHWGQGDFPFLFVQLSSFGPLKSQPGESDWALLREAQSKTLSLPNTAMAVTIDVGNPDDIHPKQKKEVGDRLAAEAMKLLYGNTKQVSNGPQLKSYRIKENRIILQFVNTGNGLTVKGKKLNHFAIAGADKKFVWADAVIEGNKIIVSNKLIQKPLAVRYAWADSPVDANFINKDGFPASPFRTDDW